MTISGYGFPTLTKAIEKWQKTLVSCLVGQMYSSINISTANKQANKIAAS